MGSKSQLAVFLSKLKDFVSPKAKEEQYMTDSEVAADMLWDAYMLRDMNSKVIADFGCGTGILGIGSLILGAKYVYFIDKDPDVFKVLRENLGVLREYGIKSERYKLINKDVKDLKSKDICNKINIIDIIIENPPFGTKIEHADKIFLEKAFEMNIKVIYSMHKTKSESFIKAICKDHDYKISCIKNYDYPLKSSMKFHKKRINKIKVSYYRLIKE